MTVQTQVARQLSNLTNVELHDVLDASGYSECAFDRVMYTHTYTGSEGQTVYAYAVSWVEDGQADLGAVYVWEVDGVLKADF